MTDRIEKTFTAAVQKVLADAADIGIDGIDVNAMKPNQINVLFANGDEADITVRYVRQTEVVRIDETIAASGVGETERRVQDSPVSIAPDEEVRQIREVLDRVPVRWRWVPGTETVMPYVISPEGREFAVADDESAEALAREANAIVEVRQTAFEDTRELALGIVHTYSALMHLAVRRSGSEVERIDGAFMRGSQGDLLKAASLQLGADPVSIPEETKCNLCGVPKEWHAPEFWEAPEEWT